MRRHERFLAYGVGGWVFEVVFTGLKGPVRDNDWRLAAHTYLWMLPIYGSAAYLFEPAHDALRARPWWQRGAAYTAGFYAVEAASGAAIRRVTGEVPWDYAPARTPPGAAALARAGAAGVRAGVVRGRPARRARARPAHPLTRSAGPVRRRRAATT